MRDSLSLPAVCAFVNVLIVVVVEGAFAQTWPSKLPQSFTTI